MAENRLKIHICRMLRSPLGSCKSKDQISDVVDNHHSRQQYQLFELSSPQPQPFTFSPIAEQSHIITNKKINTSLTDKLPFLSPDVGGRKCPPASPIISPLNSNFHGISREKKKPRNKKKIRSTVYKKCSRFEDQFPECKYNGLFSSDDDDDKRAAVFSWRRSSTTSSRRRMEAEVAVEDSLAVVKRSSDPYNDFRSSMVEMIVEKQLFSANDLENLLQCFLSLNSYHHHKIIIQVFAEIWEALLL